MYLTEHLRSLLVTGQWFSLDTLVSSTDKTDDIAEILLKVALNTIIRNLEVYKEFLN